MSLPVLYSFRRCPYAMRARLAIAASETQCRLREVVLRNKPQALIDASPKATVPVVVLPDGGVLEESLDIMLWALQSNDPQKWLEPERDNLADMLSLISECDQHFKGHLDRYKYPQRFADDSMPVLSDNPPGAQQTSLTDSAADATDADASAQAGDPDVLNKARSLAHRKAGAQWLLKLDAQLQNQAFLFGARAALADMALAPFVRQFAHVDRQWFDDQNWPHLRQWLDTWMASKLFESVMKKYQPWTPESETTVFPPL